MKHMDWCGTGQLVEEMRKEKEDLKSIGKGPVALSASLINLVEPIFNSLREHREKKKSESEHE